MTEKERKLRKIKNLFSKADLANIRKSLEDGTQEASAESDRARREAQKKARMIVLD